MEVLFQVAPSSSFVRARTAASPPPDHTTVDSPWNSFNSDFRSFDSGKGLEDEIDYRSDCSSSIGVPDDVSDGESVVSSTGGDREEEEEEEIRRNKFNAGFASLGSLEESLPIK